MANRYKIPNDANSNVYGVTSSWSTVSGGGGGASVPGAGDSIIFDSASGTNDVTVDSNYSCLDITITATATCGIDIGFGQTLTCNGNISLSSGGKSITDIGTLTCAGTSKTITYNGATISSLMNVTGSYTAQDTAHNAAVTIASTGSLSYASRTVTLTGDFTLTGGTFIITGASITSSRTGANAFKLTGSTTPTITNTSSTGTLTFSGASPTLTLGTSGHTADWAGTNITLSGASGTATITGYATNIGVITNSRSASTTMAFGSSATISCAKFWCQSTQRTITWATGATLTCTVNASDVVLLSGASQAAPLTLTGFSGGGTDAIISTTYTGLTVSYAAITDMRVKSGGAYSGWTATYPASVAGTNTGWDSFHYLNITGPDAIGATDAAAGVLRPNLNGTTGGNTVTAGNIFATGNRTGTTGGATTTAGTVTGSKGAQVFRTVTETIGVTDTGSFATTDVDLVGLTDTVTVNHVGLIQLSGTTGGNTTTAGAVAGREGDQGTTGGNTVTAGSVTGTSTGAGNYAGSTGGNTTTAGTVTGKAARKGTGTGTTTTTGTVVGTATGKSGHTGGNTVTGGHIQPVRHGTLGGTTVTAGSVTGTGPPPPPPPVPQKLLGLRHRRIPSRIPPGMVWEQYAGTVHGRTRTHGHCVGIRQHPDDDLVLLLNEL